MLKNMKIKTSLLMGYIITITVSVAIIITSVVMLNFVRNDYNELLEDTVSANLDVTTARLDANIAARNLRDILLTPHDSANASMLARAKEAIEEMDYYLGLLQKNFPSDQDKTDLNKYVAAAATWKASAEEIIQVYEQYKSTSNVVYLNQAIDMIGEQCTPTLNEMATLGQAVDQFLSTYQEECKDSIADYSNTIVIILIVAMIVATICVLGMALVLINSIVKPTEEVCAALVGFSQGQFDIPVEYRSSNELGAMSHAMRDSQRCLTAVVEEVSYLMGEMAKGNFALRFKDESIYVGGLQPMREAIRGINHNLSDTLSQISMSAEQVTGGSEQVSTGAQALAQGATEQASAVEELSATIQEISSNSQRNARRSEEALKQTQYAAAQLDESAHNMDEMVRAMDKITESSQEISKIIATIENIAFQTNILALNAAVEAARAGSAGKGFAVVADEVRNLATKSDQAAKATKELIDNSNASVQDGNHIVERVSISLQKTVEATDELKKSIDGIAKAVEEEAEAITQVTNGIDQISSVVQTNSATSEESAATSEELSSQASIMKALMAKFKLRSTEDDLRLSASTGASRRSTYQPQEEEDLIESSAAGSAAASSPFSKY